MSDEERADRTSDERREDESKYTGHDKYRPINLQSNQSDSNRSRSDSRRYSDKDGSEATGRQATGMRRYGTTETERGVDQYGREHRSGNGPGGGVSEDDAHRSASERHRSGRGGRSSNQRHYDSRSLQQGQSSGNPRTGSQRGSHREEGLSGRLGGQRRDYRTGPGDDQESLGDQYQYGGDRGGSQRDRRYGSRHGNSTQTDPRRE